MRHRTARALALLALAIAQPVAVAGDETPAARLQASFALDLDASGRIVSLAPVGHTAEGLADELRPVIAGWAFEPGRIDGVAAPTQTTINITLAARRTVGDAVSLRVVEASAGPRVGNAVPPRYPVQSLRAGESGEVLVRVEVDDEGRPAAPSIAQSTAPKRLERAAIEAIRQWTFVPERVGGHAIASTLLVPLRFCITGKPCARLPIDLGVGDGDHPRLTGEPTVRIARPDTAG
jgi:TonB family protein